MTGYLHAIYKRIGTAKFTDNGGTPAPLALAQLQLTGNAYQSSATLGSTIGSVSGRTPGSTLTYTVTVANAAVFSPATLLVTKGSASPVPAAGASQTFNLAVTETLIGAIGSPRTTTFPITVSTASASNTVKTIEPVGAKTRSGIKVTQLASGAAISGTNSAHWTNTAGAIAVSDTGQDALAGTYTFTVTGDAAVTQLIIPIEAGNVLDTSGDFDEALAAAVYAVSQSRTTDWIISPRAGSVWTGGASANNQRQVSNNNFQSFDGSLRGQVVSSNLIKTALATPAYDTTTGVVSGTGAPPNHNVKVFVNGVQYPRVPLADRNGVWSVQILPKPVGTPTLTAESHRRATFAERVGNTLTTIAGGSITFRARTRGTVEVKTSLWFAGVGPLGVTNLNFTRVKANPVQDTYYYDADGKKQITTGALTSNNNEPHMLKISSLTSVTGSREYYAQAVLTGCDFGSATTNVDAYQAAFTFSGDIMVVQDCKGAKLWRPMNTDITSFVELKRNMWAKFTNDVIDAYQVGYYPQQVSRRCNIVVLRELVCDLAQSPTQSNNHSDWLQFGAAPQLFYNTTTSNVMTGATVSASSNDADAYKAFDLDSLNNQWAAATTGTEYLQWRYTTGTPTGVLAFYSLMSSRTTGVKSAPQSWTVEGSNDGVTWTVLDTRANETGWAAGESRYYFCTPRVNGTANTYTWFRWNFTASNDGATPVAIMLLEAGHNGCTNQIIDKLVADNTAIMAADVKIQATQIDESDHSLLPIIGHIENNMLVGNTPNLIRTFWSKFESEGLTIKNNTLLNARPTTPDRQPAPYNDFGGGTNDVPGGISMSRAGTGVSIVNNVIPSIWENYGSQWYSEPPAGRVVSKVGGAYVATGNVYSQCYKRNTGDGYSFPEIFANVDNIFTYREATPEEQAQLTANGGGVAKVGWQWWQLMPVDTYDNARAWLARNFKTVGNATGKGWDATP